MLSWAMSGRDRKDGGWLEGAVVGTASWPPFRGRRAMSRGGGGVRRVAALSLGLRRLAVRLGGGRGDRRCCVQIGAAPQKKQAKKKKVRGVVLLPVVGVCACRRKGQNACLCWESTFKQQRWGLVQAPPCLDNA